MSNYYFLLIALLVVLKIIIIGWYCNRWASHAGARDESDAPPYTITVDGATLAAAARRQAAAQRGPTPSDRVALVSRADSIDVSYPPAPDAPLREDKHVTLRTLSYEQSFDNP